MWYITGPHNPDDHAVRNKIKLPHSWIVSKCKPLIPGKARPEAHGCERDGLQWYYWNESGEPLMVVWVDYHNLIPNDM